MYGSSWLLEPVLVWRVVACGVVSLCFLLLTIGYGATLSASYCLHDKGFGLSVESRKIFLWYDRKRSWQGPGIRLGICGILIKGQLIPQL